MFRHSGLPFLNLVIFLCIMLLLSSCTYKYLGPEEPEELYSTPCPGYTEEQAQYYAFSVILNALNDRGWDVDSVDQDKFIIIAKAKPPEWTKIKVTVKLKGLIVFQRTNPADLGRKKYGRMLRWIRNLKHLYNKRYRCPIQERDASSISQPESAYIYPDGSKYDGEWKNGMMNGQGTLNYSDGTKYEGQWKDGKAHGMGIMTWPDNAQYVGQWKDNKKNGQGAMTYPDGTKQVGEFRDGKFVEE